MSLPEFGGMDTGFNPYHGADPWEYDLVLTNSEGGIPRLLELGARRADALFWGADPEFFSPQPVEKDVDVFFYGYGDKFRRDWMKTMVGEPSRIASELDFALGGLDFQGDTGVARVLGDVPFNLFARAISAARVNLNITRRPHATVSGSSTARPFELASSGAAIVSNPHEGIERWFEPGRELVVVESAGRPWPRIASSCRSRPGGGDGARARARPRRAHVRPPRAAPRARRARGRGRGVTRARGRPRLQRVRRDRLVVDEIRAPTPGSTSSSSTTRRPTTRPPSRRAPGDRPPAALQRRHRRRGPTGFGMPRRGLRARGRLDGTASTTPSEIGSCSASRAGRPTRHRLRFVDGGAVPAPFARRLGIRVFARLVSVLGGQRVTDTTSGSSRSIGRHRALRAQYPHDYPEVEATLVALAAVRRRRCRSRCASGRVSSITFVRRSTTS
jgi:hypothetical protein